MEWICGNGIAEIGGKKIVPIGLWQCHCRNRGERYKKKYTYSYSLSIFLTETVWFVTFFYGKSILWNRKGYFKYIDSYSKVHTVNKNKKKYRDKDRFKYIDSYSKVHAVNRNKKKIHRFL